jgi:hypothetical protein
LRKLQTIAHPADRRPVPVEIRPLAREYEVGEVTIWRAIKAPLEVSAAA